MERWCLLIFVKHLKAIDFAHFHCLNVHFPVSFLLYNPEQLHLRLPWDWEVYALVNALIATFSLLDVFKRSLLLLKIHCSVAIYCWQRKRQAKYFITINFSLQNLVHLSPYPRRKPTSARKREIQLKSHFIFVWSPFVWKRNELCDFQALVRLLARHKAGVEKRIENQKEFLQPGMI